MEKWKSIGGLCLSLSRLSIEILFYTIAVSRKLYSVLPHHFSCLNLCGFHVALKKSQSGSCSVLLSENRCTNTAWMTVLHKVYFFLSKCVCVWCWFARWKAEPINVVDTLNAESFFFFFLFRINWIRLFRCHLCARRLHQWHKFGLQPANTNKWWAAAAVRPVYLLWPMIVFVNMCARRNSFALNTAVT